MGSPDGVSTDTALPAGPAAEPGPGPAEAGAVPPAVAPLPGSVSPPIPERNSTIAGPLPSPSAGAANAASGPELTAPAGSGEVAVGVHGVPVQGVAGVRVEPELGTTGALYALLGIGGVALVGATRLLRWRGARP